MRRARISLIALLAAAAVLLRSSVGVLLGIMALLALLDVAVPMPGRRRAAADDAFRRAVRRRHSARRLESLARRGHERLSVLDDRSGWAATAQRHARGVQTIALDSITGTCEQAKATTFDTRFRPDWHSHGRWQGIWLAREHGGELPPVAVYRVGGEHYVRDGHHRISVARARGERTIEAHVVELVRNGRP